jgi:hypothetical protein
MSSSYGVFAFIQGVPGIALIALPLVIGVLGTPPGRRVWAFAPGLIAITTFTIACAVSPHTSSNSTLAGYIFTASMGLALISIIPALLALRNRWLGFFHLLTAAGLLFLFFVGAMALSHDWI